MPGTSSHTRIRLADKGMKKIDGYGHGDHYVTFKIAVPKSLSKEQKALLQAYAELEKDTPGQILGVTFKTDGSKHCVSESQDVLEAIRSALVEKKTRMDTNDTSHECDKKANSNVEPVDEKPDETNDVHINESEKKASRSRNS